MSDLNICSSNGVLVGGVGGGVGARGSNGAPSQAKCSVSQFSSSVHRQLPTVKHLPSLSKSVCSTKVPRNLSPHKCLYIVSPLFVVAPRAPRSLRGETRGTVLCVLCGG